MTRSEFLIRLDDLLELDRGTLKGSERLDEVGWDSLSALGFIAMLDQHLQRSVSPPNLMECKTIDDLIRLAGPEAVR